MSEEDDLSTRYSYADPNDPFLLETRAGTFGGPDDKEDNGKFAFGGGSTMPDGSINPENYAAVPEELYKQGIIKPGQPFKVTNPSTGVTTIVIARDKGPSAPGRGLDLAPHAMQEIGANTDEPLVVDFRPITPQEHAASQPFGMSGPVNTSLSDITPSPEPQAPNPMQVFDPSKQGLSELTPISSGIPTPQIPVNPDQQEERLKAFNQGINQNILADATSNQLKPTGGLIPKIVETRPDGSSVWDNGGVTYPNGIVELKAGNEVYRYVPGKKEPEIVKDTAKNPTVHMVKDENGNPLPYTMKDGKLIRVPMEGEVSPEQANIPEGAMGDDAIKGLSPEDQARVKGFANNELPPPVAGRPNPLFNKLYPYIKAYKPTYSVTDFPAAQQLKKQYYSSNISVAGGQINSINTAVDHLAELYDLADKLDGSKLRKYNSVANYIANEGGNPDVAAYKAAANKVGLELDRAFRGGVATAGGEREAMDSLNAANSPEQLKTVIGRVLPNMLNQRLGEIGYPYEEFFGKPFPGLVRPNTKKIMSEKFGIGDFGQTEAGKSTDTHPAVPVQHLPSAAEAAARKILSDPLATPEDKAKATAALAKLGVQ